MKTRISLVFVIVLATQSRRNEIEKIVEAKNHQKREG